METWQPEWTSEDEEEARAASGAASVAAEASAASVAAEASVASVAPEAIAASVAAEASAASVAAEASAASVAPEASGEASGAASVAPEASGEASVASGAAEASAASGAASGAEEPVAPPSARMAWRAAPVMPQCVNGEVRFMRLLPDQAPAWYQCVNEDHQVFMLAERAAELQIWSVPVHSPVCEPEPEVDEAFHHGNYAPVRPHCRVGEIKFMRLEMYAEPGWYLCTNEVSQTFVSADREGGGDKGAVQEGDKEARAKKRQEAVQEGDKGVQEGDKEARAKKRQEAARREKLRCEQIDLSDEPDSGVWELGEDVEWLPRVIPRVPSPRPEVGPDEMATAQATPPRPPRPPEPPIFTIEDDSQDREPVDEEFEGMTDEDDDKRGLDEGEGEDEDDEGEDEDDEGEGEDEEGEDEGEDEGDEHDDKRGLDEDEDDEHDDKRGRYDKDYDTDETYSDDMGNSGF